MSTHASENFFGLEPEWADPSRAQVAILSIPYEHTTSYGRGTKDAPQAIMEASHYLELYDEELDAEIFRLCDGITTLPAMHFDAECRDAFAIEMIRKEIAQHIETKRLVVSVGGEHTIAVGIAQAFTEKYPDLSILHLDAHSDFRDKYEDNRYSHATVMRRIYEFNRNIAQIGIRSQSAGEAAFIKKNKINTYYAFEMKEVTRSSWETDVITNLNKEVYVTFDCDFFDPSVVPSLGTPEPGGFLWHETMDFLRTLSAQRKIVGFDINELSPIPQLSYPQFTIAKLMYKWIGYIFAPGI